MSQRLSTILRWTVGCLLLLVLSFSVVRIVDLSTSNGGELFSEDPQAVIEIRVGAQSVTLEDRDGDLHNPPGTPVLLSCWQMESGRTLDANGVWRGARAELRRTTRTPVELDQGRWYCGLNSGNGLLDTYYEDSAQTGTLILLASWGLILLGFLPAVFWMRRRAKLKGADPSFRAQQRLGEDKRWVLLRVAPSQLIVYDRQPGADLEEHWQVQGEALLGAEQKRTLVQVQTTDGRQLFRVRAMRRESPRLVARLLTHSPLLIVAIGLGMMIFQVDPPVAFQVAFFVALACYLLLWPGIWFLDLVDARLLTRQLRELSARWPQQPQARDGADGAPGTVPLPKSGAPAAAAGAEEARAKPVPAGQSDASATAQARDTGETGQR